MNLAIDMDTALAGVNIFLLTLLFITAIAIARLRNLFAIVMLSGVYSLVSAAWYVLVDAVDVGFTEAAVGAGMSTAVLLGAMLLTARVAKPASSRRWIMPLIVCVLTGAGLLYATADLPAYGDASSPANTGVGRTYLEVNWADTAIPNVVTSVLASYRGFDTLGETTVVFLAGLGVALLLGFGERSLGQTVRRNDRAMSRAARKHKGKAG
jgi:multicomponent Na+:H+ antiporter subunit B